MMRSRRSLVPLIAPLAGVLLLSGCGGGATSNGIDKLSPSAAVSKVKAAVADVHSVHVKGTINQSGQSLTLDLFVGSGAAKGTVGVGGGTMDLRFVDGVTYFRADSKVFAAFGANTAQSSLAAGKWIKDSGSTGLTASFSTFLDSKKLFNDLLNPQGTISKGGTASVNGRKALILVDSSSGAGKLYVAATGDAVPLRIENSGPNGGRVDFTDYNVDVSVDAPSGAIDLSQLSGG